MNSTASAVPKRNHSHAWRCFSALCARGEPTLFCSASTCRPTNVEVSDRSSRGLETKGPANYIPREHTRPKRQIRAMEYSVSSDILRFLDEALNRTPAPPALVLPEEDSCPGSKWRFLKLLRLKVL